MPRTAFPYTHAYAPQILDTAASFAIEAGRSAVKIGDNVHAYMRWYGSDAPVSPPREFVRPIGQLWRSIDQFMDPFEMRINRSLNILETTGDGEFVNLYRQGPQNQYSESVFRIPGADWEARPTEFLLNQYMQHSSSTPEHTAQVLKQRIGEFAEAVVNAGELVFQRYDQRFSLAPLRLDDYPEALAAPEAHFADMLHAPAGEFDFMAVD